ncbi:hypothetical protein [gamma proteobacterium SS-5]|uniref:hypothetical protein n=1 Tax=Magnetovirga frankeli TaxID=947516 RepID=UPI0012941018
MKWLDSAEEFIGARKLRNLHVHEYMPGFLLSWGVIAFFLWLGIRQFRRMEKSFADLI